MTRLLLPLFVSLITCLPAMAEDAPDPMAALGRLVGGAWYLQGGKPLNAYHRYEWGVNKKILHVKSYAIGETEDRLFTESAYFWNPAKQKYVTYAVAAGGEVYDGVMTVDGSTFTLDFDHVSAKGSVAYHETWEFKDDDTYVWTLFRKTAEGLKQQIQATFKRKR